MTARTALGVGALLAALAVTLWARPGFAQACCAGSTAATPGRLALHEDALVGLALRAAVVHGSFDGGGVYRPNPPGAGELGLEQDLVAALRVLERGQASVLLPLVETRRTVPGSAELGGGVGDVALGARWDATLSGASSVVPGVALLGGLTLPTGRPVDAAKKPFATDATGTGALAGALGVGIEQRFERVYVGLVATVAFRAPRTVEAIREQLAPLWAVQLAAAWLPGDAALGFAIATTYEGDATIDGARAPATARRATIASLIAATPIAGAWRAQGAIFAIPGVRSLGESQPATVGLALTGIYAWM